MMMTTLQLFALRAVANPDSKTLHADRRMKQAFSWLMERGFIRLTKDREFVPTRLGRASLSRAGFRAEARVARAHVASLLAEKT